MKIVVKGGEQMEGRERRQEGGRQNDEGNKEKK